MLFVFETGGVIFGLYDDVLFVAIKVIKFDLGGGPLTPVGGIAGVTPLHDP